MEVRYSCYPEGKKRAVTFSYDDGHISDRRLVEIFNKYNMKATFHLNSSRYFSEDAKNGKDISADELAALYDGHEISSHTYNHPDMCELNVNELREEVLEDRKFLEEKAGYIVRGMSYPYGTYNDYVLGALPYLGIEYSRTVNSTNGFRLPENFLEWHPTCHHKNALELIEKFSTYSFVSMPIMYIWGHSYEFDRQNNWEVIEQICEKLSKIDDVWYATNIEIMDYVKAVRGLKFSVDNEMVYNTSGTDVYFEVRKDRDSEWKMIKVGAGEKLNLK